MVPDPEYEITGVDLSDDRYTVEQSLVRNGYRALDASGDTVLRGKQKLFEPREEFPFADADGDRVGSIRGQFSLRDRYEITIHDPVPCPGNPSWPLRW